jgi:hypothetical protein
MDSLMTIYIKIISSSGDGGRAVRFSYRMRPWTCYRASSAAVYDYHLNYNWCFLEDSFIRKYHILYKELFSNQVQKFRVKHTNW